MTKSFSREAVARGYANARRIARQEALAVLAQIEGVPLLRLTEINETALRAWERQWLPEQEAWKPGGFDWREQFARHAKSADAFRIALWSGTSLCGLAVGRPSTSHIVMRVEPLEGSPVTAHPGKGYVLVYVETTARAYAKVLGCRELRFMNPLPETEVLYQALGYSLVHTTNDSRYFTKGVVNDA